MKNLLVLLFFVPFLSKAQFTLTNTSTISLVELRNGSWPVELQRSVKNNDTCYILSFRDQQVTDDVNMVSLRFGNLEQLRYFMKGLAALKTGTNGDQANYKDYSLKRMDVKKTSDPKKSETWYKVECNNGPVTNFQQSEADKMIATIKSL
jgi:hypothetical protein